MVIRQFLGAFADQPDDERSPTGLVTGAEAFTGLGVKILVEQHQVLPRGIIIVTFGDAPAETRSITIRIFLEDGDQAFADEICDLIQGQFMARTSRSFDLEGVPVEMVIALERFDDEEVDGKPDRAAPVRVAAEHPAVALARDIADFMILATVVEPEGLLLMDLAEGADAKAAEELLFIDESFETAPEPLLGMEWRAAAAIRCCRAPYRDHNS